MGKNQLFARKVGNRNTKARFLLVCEGEKTEPCYFGFFRTTSNNIVIEGLHVDPLSLVEKACEIKNEDDYDQVWVVFDRDDVPTDRLNCAFFRALDNNIGIAYSNEAFELWYVLHFEYLNTGESRRKYSSKLSRHLGKVYKKNDKLMYELIKEKQLFAINNASKLLGLYDNLLSGKGNPVTTVHLLVKELNENGKKDRMEKVQKTLKEIFKYQESKS